MGPVIFRCPKTQKEFDSGFRAEVADLETMPQMATIRLRCVICAEIHEFKFADGHVGEAASAQPR